MSRTHRDTKAGDALFVTLRDHRVSHAVVVRLSVRDHHHHLGSSWAAAVLLAESRLTGGDRHELPFPLRWRAIEQSVKLTLTNTLQLNVST